MSLISDGAQYDQFNSAFSKCHLVHLEKRGEQIEPESHVH